MIPARANALVEAARRALGSSPLPPRRSRTPTHVSVGVTGHRALADRDRLEAGVDAALARIERAFPALALEVVSSIAEGADLLVAERALRHPGARLVVVLPFEQDRYLADFSPAARAEFVRMLARAHEVVTLPPARTPADAYAAAGRYVLSQSDVLLAVWDGKNAQGKGGTGEIVTRARRHQLPIARVHAGNRRPGTMEPTSLGDEQGRVSYEHFRPPAIPFRFRIAVAGARDLGETPELLAAIRTALDREVMGLLKEPWAELLERYPLVRPAYTVITSLDEGAERIVARSIVQRHDCRIDAVLPLPEKDFKAELRDDDSRAEFDQLSATARQVWPLRQPLEAAPASGERSKKIRQAYTRFDHHLVDHADVVLLIGEPTTPAGGARILRETADAKGRPIITISATAPHELKVDPQDGLKATALRRLADFNRWRLRPKALDAYVRNAGADAFQNISVEVVPVTIRETIAEVLLPFYAQASTIAKHNQKRYFRTGLAVYVLAMIAVGCVAAGLVWPALSLAMVLLEVGCLLAIVIAVLSAHFSHRHRKYVENRFVAERMRSAVFLAACGVEARRMPPPPYIAHVDQPDDWMLRVFDEAWNRLPRLERCTEARCQIVNGFVRERWLQDQIDFHRAKSEREASKSHWFEYGGYAAFGLAFLLAGIHLMELWPALRASAAWLLVFQPADAGRWFAELRDRAAHGPSSEPHTLNDIMAFAAILLPAVGAGLGGMRAHREYNRLAKRHAAMTAALADLDRRFQDVMDPADLTDLLSAAEELTLRETQDWVALIAQKPIEPA
jgi:hypothetical protein